VGDNRDGNANWGTAFTYVTWLLWHYHGDTAVITRTLPQLELRMAFLEGNYNKTASSGLKNYWPACISGWTVVGPVSECSLMTAFPYVNELRMMAEMMEAIGDASSVVYRTRYEARLATFHSSFYHANTSSYGHDTLDDLGMALWLDAAPTPDIRAAVASRLAAKVEEQLGIVNPNSSSVAPGTAMSGGVGVRYLYEALGRTNYTDVALRLAMRKTFPSYGYMYYNEHEPATALWELWDSDIGSPIMDSRNHIYSASISTFFFKHLAGIDCVTAGFDRAIVAPVNIPLNNGTSASAVAGGLTTLDTSIGTPHGAVTSSWTLLDPNSVPVATCGVKSESPTGWCSQDPKDCARVNVGCKRGQVITAVPFASFGMVEGDCDSGLRQGTCHTGPNGTAYVAKLCVGNESCSVTVDWEVFGDPCPGTRKELGIQVTCGPSPHPPPPSAPSQPAYRLAVVIPVGVVADVVVPLRSQEAAAVTITEGGVAVWSNGKFSAVPGISAGSVDETRGGVGFAVAQGRYTFELLV
jgi:hypothetical protein